MSLLSAGYYCLLDQGRVLFQGEAAGQYDVFAAQLQVFDINTRAYEHGIAFLRRVDGRLDRWIREGHLQGFG